MVTNFNWTCPYCNHAQTVTDSNYFSTGGKVRNPPAEFGPVAYNVHSVACQNKKCGRMTFGAALYQREDYAGVDAYKIGNLVQSWTLLPESLS